MWTKSKKPSSLDYARFAQMYYLTLLNRRKNSIYIMAYALNVPMSTIKERVRKCRELGYLTSPGKGKMNSSQLTDKAKEILGI